jgi:type IV pilus assembly protein PilA
LKRYFILKIQNLYKENFVRMKMVMRQQSKKRKGFTLVELIIIIAILAILAVAAIIAYGNIQDNARTSLNRANAATIVRAVNTYNSLGGGGPTELAGITLAVIEDMALTDPVEIDLSVRGMTAEEVTDAIGEMVVNNGVFSVSRGGGP